MRSRGRHLGRLPHLLRNLERKIEKLIKTIIFHDSENALINLFSKLIVYLRVVRNLIEHFELISIYSLA